MAVRMLIFIMVSFVVGANHNETRIILIPPKKGE
jgi:hypothetical protein